MSLYFCRVRLYNFVRVIMPVIAFPSTLMLTKLAANYYNTTKSTLYVCLMT